MTPAQREWLAQQNTTPTGDPGTDRLIAQSLSHRFFQQFPRARRFVLPDELQYAFDLTHPRSAPLA